MTRHRLHSRVKTLERKARRRPLGKRWAWLAVHYPADTEIEIANEACQTFDRLRLALAAIHERFERWRKRNPNQPGMPLKSSERPVVGEALRCADYVTEFDGRFPHRDDGVPCRVVHGDAELLAKQPPGTSFVIWQVVEPVLSPEDAAVKAEHEVRRLRALDAPDEPPAADTADSPHSAPPQRPLSDDELRRRQARESFERQTGEWGAKTWRGCDHAPSADAEFKQARREGRVRVRGVDFFGSTTPRGRR